MYESKDCKFNVGDIVDYKDIECVVTRQIDPTCDGSGISYQLKEKDGVREYKGNIHVHQGDISLIKKPNNKTMNIKEKFVQLFLTEPEKSFRKAGFTDGDGILTTEGQQVFITWLLKRNGTDFKKEVVDELLKKEDEE
jgi:hypothetical protein